LIRHKTKLRGGKKTWEIPKEGKAGGSGKKRKYTTERTRKPGPELKQSKKAINFTGEKRKGLLGRGKKGWKKKTHAKPKPGRSAMMIVALVSEREGEKGHVGGNQ